MRWFTRYPQTLPEWEAIDEFLQYSDALSGCDILFADCVIVHALELVAPSYVPLVQWYMAALFSIRSFHSLDIPVPSMFDDPLI